MLFCVAKGLGRSHTLRNLPSRCRWNVSYSHQFPHRVTCYHRRRLQLHKIFPRHKLRRPTIHSFDDRCQCCCCYWWRSRRGTTRAGWNILGYLIFAVAKLCYQTAVDSLIRHILKVNYKIILMTAVTRQLFMGFTCGKTIFRYVLVEWVQVVAV